jgi:MFS family permease
MADDTHGSGLHASGAAQGSTILPWRQWPWAAAGCGLPVRSLAHKDVRPPLESLHALDWLNFFLAALLMGFGPFVAVKLADRGWVPANIGLVLTASALAGLLTQVPAGELIDMVKSKRALVGTGTAAISLAVLTVGLRPDLTFALAAAVTQGTAGSVLGPGITAISLGLVGHKALAERLGRNQRFASIGGLTAAGVMGVVGYLLSSRDIFLLTAAFGVPVVFALVKIRAGDIHFGRSCGAPDVHSTSVRRVSRAVLFKDRRLVTFAVCLFLFQLANASILPLIGEGLAHAQGRRSSLIMSALIVVPQIIVALLAPWVGRTANSWGRRPLLLIGLGVVPIRAGVFAFTADPAPLILIQALDGLSGATLGVLTALVIADVATGTGRFNLAQGLVGTLSAIGASLSTSISGIVVEKFGQMAGFLSMTMVGLMAVAIFWAFMPETKPSALPQRPASVDPKTVASDGMP